MFGTVLVKVSCFDDRWKKPVLNMAAGVGKKVVVVEGGLEGRGLFAIENSVGIIF